MILRFCHRSDIIIVCLCSAALFITAHRALAQTATGYMGGYVFTGSLDDGTRAMANIAGTANPSQAWLYLAASCPLDSVTATLTYHTARRGSLAGTMKRCTNPELMHCGLGPTYDTPCTGEFRLRPTGTAGQTQLDLKLEFDMEIWNKDKCAKDHKERREVRAELIDVANASPRPSPWDVVLDSIQP
jgi:hypothetical protein